MESEVIVMKFGGASVEGSEQFSKIADIILKKAQKVKVVVVVSAMKGMTDQLLALAKRVNPEPPLREQDMLISVGERVSIALLVMALKLKGEKEAISFTGSQSGIITTSEHSEARIITVKPHRILRALKEDKIPIVAGFQGVSIDAEITTLGRGGSDTTAVALGVCLQASRVEFYKDVYGIYSLDPKKNPQAICHPYLSYEEALQLCEKGAKVLHSRCIRLAAKNGIPLHVLSFFDPDQNEHCGTLIGRYEKKPPVYEECLP